jgi:1-deoxy-D-xylulose-5-phosphate synthase
MNEIELRNIMYTAQMGLKGPIAIRYPRGRGVTLDWKKDFEFIELGTARCLKEGSKIAILSIGHIGNEVERLLETLNNPDTIGHYDMRFVKPLDKKMLRTIFKKYDHIVTIEDGSKIGGFGTAVLEFSNEEQWAKTVTIFGIPDQFVAQGTIPETQQLAGIDFDTFHSFIKSTLDQCD